MSKHAAERKQSPTIKWKEASIHNCSLWSRIRDCLQILSIHFLIYFYYYYIFNFFFKGSLWSGSFYWDFSGKYICNIWYIGFHLYQKHRDKDFLIQWCISAGLSAHRLKKVDTVTANYLWTSLKLIKLLLQSKGSVTRFIKDSSLVVVDFKWWMREGTLKFCCCHYHFRKLLEDKYCFYLKATGFERMSHIFQCNLTILFNN